VTHDVTQRPGEKTSPAAAPDGPRQPCRVTVQEHIVRVGETAPDLASMPWSDPKVTPMASRLDLGSDGPGAYVPDENAPPALAEAELRELGAEPTKEGAWLLDHEMLTYTLNPDGTTKTVVAEAAGEGDQWFARYSYAYECD
jgi:hypothetical protein